MGQSHHHNNRLNNQWTLVDTLGRIEIYKNQNHQLAQKHIVRADPKIQQRDYITAYQQRYLPNKPIVNAFDAQFVEQSGSMCQNSSVITVFTEYIPHRLSDVKMLNHGQGMYVLSEALAGFSELYGRVGPFQIHEDLIGFNQEGEVRVWYNPNFADNAVDSDRIILMSTVNPYDFDRKFSQNQEHDMIEDTINAITRYTQFHPHFLQQAQQLKKLSFYDARRMLSSQIGRKGYYVPDHLFLGDKNEIIKKSGIQLKHKHVFNPNKPRKGQKYPYFYDGLNNQPNQAYYQQGEPQYGYYDNDYSESSQSDFQYNGQGGYYNMHGQNYRVLDTREVEGNVNEQAIIDEVMRSNGYNQQSQQAYSNAPNYAQVRSRVDQYYPEQQGYSYVQTQQQHVNPPKQYQEGHIVVSDAPQFQEKSRTKITYMDPNQYAHQNQMGSQQSVRVFSVGQNGGVVEQTHHLNQPHYQPHYQPQYQPIISQNNPNLRSHYQPNTSISEVNRSYVYPGNYTHEAPQQFPIQPHNITHRNKIFGQTSQQRIGNPMPEQRAF